MRRTESGKMDSSFNTDSNFFSAENTSEHFLAMKDANGRYLFYVDTGSLNASIEDLESNGMELCAAERYKEALECYRAALDKRGKSSNSTDITGKWNCLVNYSIPLINLGYFQEGLEVLKEALEILKINKQDDLYGWMVIERINSLQKTIAEQTAVNVKPFNS